MDADEGSNAAVTYHIVQGAEGKFIIEGQIQFIIHSISIAL